MFMAAAHALAARVSESDLAQGSLYPSLTHIREVSVAIATAVATTAWQLGIAGMPRPADIEAHVRAQMFEPRYKSYV
jgi:malate dehydrogenase (oxaloacetate-decarboxylating)(NADP+)